MKRMKIYSTMFVTALIAVNAMAGGYPDATPGKRSSHYSIPKNAVDGKDYKSKTVVARVKPEYRNYCNATKIEHYDLQQYMTFIGTKAMAKKFPRHQPPATLRTRDGHKTTDLSLIYEMEYSADVPLEKVINSMLSTGLFEYVEPYYIPKPMYAPNDPGYTSSQKASFSKMQIEQAWDVTKGSASVLIGIVDTGFNNSHEDLAGNLYTNPNEIAGNSIDDDNNGYVDDVNGYDIGEGDNDAKWNKDAHGTHVAGLAAATSDNGKGGAGTGFSCKYLPVKVSNADGEMRASYEGIVYAAEMGCHVINCSFGGPNGGGFVQNIIDYVTIDKNALVIASSGNDAADSIMYPAALDKVISVGATTSADKKASFSNYGYTVDVMAVGNQVYSTYQNSYSALSGTSMSAPVTSGVAGLIKAAFPSYTSLQIAAQLKATCDNIYGINSALYKDKLGKGRINAKRAVTETNNYAAGITLPVDSLYDNNDDAIVVGDTMRMVMSVSNYLAAATNMSATLTTTSTAVTILDGTASYGAMATNETKQNKADPFKVIIKPSAKLNENVLFTLTLTEGSYTEAFKFTIQVNVDYMNIEVNEISTTMTSRGLVGYNQGMQVQGKGLQYKNMNTLFEAGLMIGIQNRVSDVVRNANSPTNDDDFKTVSRITEVVPSPYNAAFHGESKFDDSNNPNPLGLEVTHRGFAWNEPGHTKYVMVEYAFTNKSANTYSDLYAGIFVDWDIHDKNTFFKNRCGTDHTNRFGYVYLTDPGGLYAGIKLLSYTAPFNHYAMNLRDTAGTWGINANYHYNDTTKYVTMSTPKDTAGGKDPGVDVAGVISSGPFTLAPNETKTISFALMVGDDLGDLKNTSIKAQEKYNGISGVEQLKALNTLKLEQNIPNPASNKATVYFNLPNKSDVLLKVINMVGQEVTTLVNGEMQQGWNEITFDVSKLEAGIYYYQLTSGNETITKKMTIVH